MPSLPTRILAGVTVLDTPLIAKALAYARKNCNDITYNHVVRSWLFGQVIADNSPDLKDRDVELHSLAAILHDMGWSHNPSLISPDKRFEVDSANVTRDFIIREGEKGEWDSHRLQLIWDIVALHTIVSIAVHKEVEVKVCCVGIGAEFVPFEASYGGVLTSEVWDGIVKEFPRTNFKEGLTETLCGLCRTKPAASYDNFVGNFGAKYVEGYSLEGRRLVDQIKMVVN